MIAASVLYCQSCYALALGRCCRLDSAGKGYITVRDWGRPDVEGPLNYFTQLYVSRTRGADGRHKDAHEVRGGQLPFNLTRQCKRSALTTFACCLQPPTQQFLLVSEAQDFPWRMFGCAQRYQRPACYVQVQSLYAALQMALFKLQLKNSGRSISHERLVQAFEFIDRDGSGALDKREVGSGSVRQRWVAQLCSAAAFSTCSPVVMLRRY